MSTPHPPPPHDFEVWAPDARQVIVEVRGRRHALRPLAPVEKAPEPGSGARREGWWAATVPAAHGDDYHYRVDDGVPLPDPRAVWLPDGPEGPARVLDHALFPWRDQDWAGRAVLGGVLYELHVGTFTPQGTFDAAREKLEYLRELGVDAIELLPVCPFPGRHGWGYDGVAPWAVHQPYGGPEGLKALVDAAHRVGIAVLLDVVHNHLGPSGNHLAWWGPYFTDRYRTPWGSAINLDGPGSDEVHAYLIGSALAWLRDFHIDGLRLDAVHALHDQRALPLLERLSAEVDAFAATEGRPLTLLAESELNDPRTVTERAACGLGLHAQWNDDTHHALHAALTGETHGYYADFAGAAPGSPVDGPLEAVARTLTRVWLHDGVWSSFRGRTHGRPVDRGSIPGHRFLGYLQTHDQVGNRARGDRISATQPPERLAAGAALLLTSPFTPMLFMGEEWGARTPWQYFTDHPDPELAEAVSAGRRREFGEHGWDAAQVPDPQDDATVRRSRLDWDEPRQPSHAQLWDWYRSLVALRRAEPELHDPDLTATHVDYREEDRWLVVYRGALRVVCNLAAAERRIPLGGGHQESLRCWTPRSADPPTPSSGDTELRVPAGATLLLRVR